MGGAGEGSKIRSGSRVLWRCPAEWESHRVDGAVLEGLTGCRAFRHYHENSGCHQVL